jgi:hypothetical protein
MREDRGMGSEHAQFTQHILVEGTRCLLRVSVAPA